MTASLYNGNTLTNGFQRHAFVYKHFSLSKLLYCAKFNGPLRESSIPVGVYILNYADMYKFFYITCSPGGFYAHLRTRTNRSRPGFAHHVRVFRPSGNHTCISLRQPSWQSRRSLHISLLGIQRYPGHRSLSQHSCRTCPS